jgi:hypothetical protein
MRRALATIACFAWLATVGAGEANARRQETGPQASTPEAGQTETIDAIAVRIESDIITDSEVEELAAYQKLVDGKSKPRADVVRELIDQWIVRGEATAAQYPEPSTAEVDGAYAQLQKQFPSPEAFKNRCAQLQLDDAAVRSILEQQLYLARFLDFRFRPAAQVDPQQVKAYYQTQLAPRLKAQGEKVPPLEDVESEIREVLVQQEIDTLSKQWLDDTRSGLSIDILPPGESE